MLEKHHCYYRHFYLKSKEKRPPPPEIGFGNKGGGEEKTYEYYRHVFL
jgi:hypothetical protein